MFDGLGSFIRELFIKLAIKLPDSNFDVETQVSAIREYLEYINYFVPFYIFKTIFAVWATTVFGGMGIYLLFKYIKKLLGV